MRKQSLKTLSYLNIVENKQPITQAPNLTRVCKLQSADTDEVLAFLAERPSHTIVMTTWIRDNGIENNTVNRGMFYGYRNDDGKLEGVALIGHATLFETRTDEAVKAFAWQAKQSETSLHFLMAAGSSTETFWSYYVDDVNTPKLVCTQLMFEMKFPVPVREFIHDLRKATAEDLLLVAEAHAQVAFEESGVNPLEKDREKFLERTLRRIQKQRCWVVIRDGKLLFKADIVAQTSDVAYLEGIYVAPETRGKGIGSNCLSQLGRDLLLEVDSICLLSNADFGQAHNAYKKAGFKLQDKYQTIFI